MSDVTNEQKLEGVQRSLRKNSILFCIGWLLFGPTITGLAFALMMGGHDSLLMAIIIIGWGLIGFTKIKAVFFGGMGSLFKLSPDYEVVTTYGNGRAVSDGGAQSMQQNIILSLIFAGIAWFVGGFITIVQLIYLTFRYMGLRTKAKTSLRPKGSFLILMNIVVFVGALVIGGIVYKVAHADIDKMAVEEEALMKQEQTALMEAAKNAATQRVTVVVTDNSNRDKGETPISSTPVVLHPYGAYEGGRNDDGGIVARVKAGDTFRITGELIEGDGYEKAYLAPIEYKGATYYINAENIALPDSPSAKAMLKEFPAELRGTWENKNGAKVTITANTFEVAYKGYSDYHVTTVNAENIRKITAGIKKGYSKGYKFDSYPAFSEMYVNADFTEMWQNGNVFKKQ